MVEEKEFEINLSSLKKIKLSYILLIAFIILGFYLRIYHIDFPSIGYHNMKENEYLSETVFFNEQGDFLHRRTFNFWGLEDGPGYFEEYTQPPLIPYMTLPFWKIFGEQIWIPRMIVMLFMLGAIALIYFVVKELTKNEYLSLLSSFLLTIMPLGVYFGRNIQPEAPAMFFVLLASYFYIKWTDSLDKKTLLYSMIALSFAGLFKSTFLIIVIPLLFIFPYQKMFDMFKTHKKEFFGQIKYALIGIIPFVLIQGLFEITIVNPAKKAVEFSITNALNPSFWIGNWPILKSFIIDNYTWWFFWFAIFGLILVFIKHKLKISRFMIGYFAGFLVYLGILSSKVPGHSYYQMPFLPMVVILGAYFLFNLGMILKQIVNIKHIEFAVLILLLLAMGPVQNSNDRVWSTIFYGQDVVGDYLKAHMSSDTNERFFNLGHAQMQAVCIYARHRCGEFRNLTNLIELQDKFNIKYMNLDAYSLSRLQQEDKDSWSYIQQNYRIKLGGFIPNNNQLSIVNILLEKGGKFNLTELQNKQPVLAKTYDTKMGNMPFYVIEN